MTTKVTSENLTSVIKIAATVSNLMYVAVSLISAVSCAIIFIKGTANTTISIDNMEYIAPVKMIPVLNLFSKVKSIF